MRLTDPQAVIADAVATLKRKFDYPDFIGSGVNLAEESVGGGGGAPTVVIAAADSSDLSKGRADFTCSGTNDQVTIRAAIAASNALSGIVGRILFTEGTFHIVMDQSTVFSSAGDSIHYQGMGPNSTVLTIDTAPAVANRTLFLMDQESILSDMLIHQNAFDELWNPVKVLGPRVWINRMEFQFLHSERVISSPIAGSGSHFWLTDSWFNGCAMAVDLEEFETVTVRGNHFQNTDGVELTFTPSGGIGGQGADISGNWWSTSDEDPGTAIIKLVGFDSPVISGNSALVSQGFPYGFIEVDTCNGPVIVGNTIFQASAGIGIAVIDCLAAVVVGNQLDSFGGTTSDFGIAVSGTSTGCLVAVNTLRSDQDQAGNWWHYGIHVDADENTVIGNVIRQVADTCIRIEGDANFVTANDMLPSALTPQTDLGVDVVSGTGNIVVGNRFGPAGGYATDAYADTGTATLNTYPNDATYGDNFFT